MLKKCLPLHAGPPGTISICSSRVEMHRMANKDYHSKVLLNIFVRPFILAFIFFKFEVLAQYFLGDSTQPPPPPIKNQMVHP